MRYPVGDQEAIRRRSGGDQEASRRRAGGEQEAIRRRSGDSQEVLTCAFSPTRPSGVLWAAEGSESHAGFPEAVPRTSPGGGRRPLLRSELERSDGGF